jgi:hypothetical protein
MHTMNAYYKVMIALDIVFAALFITNLLTTLFGGLEETKIKTNLNQSVVVTGKLVLLTLAVSFVSLIVGPSRGARTLFLSFAIVGCVTILLNALISARPEEDYKKNKKYPY